MMFRLLFLAVVAMAMSCFAAPPPKRTIVHWMSYDEAFLLQNGPNPSSSKSIRCVEPWQSLR